MMKRMSMLVLGAVAMLSSVSSAQAVPVTWVGNGHSYDVVWSYGISWNDARSAALATPGGNWDLVTVTSSAEQAFVNSLFTSGYELWFGGYQFASATSASDGWNWVTGEAWSYTNWSGGEPNWYYGPHSEIHLGGNWGGMQAWNDEGAQGNIYGYVIETVPSEVPEPATVTLFGFGAVALAVGRRIRRKRA